MLNQVYVFQALISNFTYMQLPDIGKLTASTLAKRLVYVNLGGKKKESLFLQN